MLNAYRFMQGSPCSNVVLFTRKGNSIKILVTERDPSTNPEIGEGKSLSAGGFDKVKDAAQKAKGTMIDGTVDTYREMYEELGGAIKTIIPYEQFAGRSQVFWDGMVPSGTDNGLQAEIDAVADAVRVIDEKIGSAPGRGADVFDAVKSIKDMWAKVSAGTLVHKVVSRMMEISDEQMDAIMALPPTEETKGKILMEFELDNDPHEAVDISEAAQRLTGFHYAHEAVIAQKFLTKMAGEVKRAAPTTGPGW